MNFWLSIAQAIGRQSVQPLLERGGGFASAKAQEGGDDLISDEI